MSDENNKADFMPFPRISADAEAERSELDSFYREVWGWLIERGLVDPQDDEWDGFVTVIEEHEAEIEQSTRRELTALLAEAGKVLEANWLGRYWRGVNAEQAIEINAISAKIKDATDAR